LTVDTTSQTSERAAMQIKTALIDGRPPAAFDQLRAKFPEWRSPLGFPAARLFPCPIERQEPRVEPSAVSAYNLRSG